METTQVMEAMPDEEPATVRGYVDDYLPAYLRPIAGPALTIADYRAGHRTTRVDLPALTMED